MFLKELYGVAVSHNMLKGTISHLALMGEANGNEVKNILQIITIG
jgi:hypothetical protein